MKKVCLFLLCLMLLGAWSPSALLLADEDPHGLPPADDMVFMPKLSGLRNKTFHNHYGQAKHLSEAVVLRRSKVEAGQAQVPPGGLFYLSEVGGDAEPFMRDPFLVLGEHAYLVDLVSGKHVVGGLTVKQGDKVPVGDTRYRMWFDYATDHYQKPYAEMALIAPSGGWPLEFPIASVFPGREQISEVKVGEGLVEQIKGFYLDNEYLYGASRYVAKEVGFDKVAFDTIEFPKITEATFSMTRPIVLEVRQEDYRLYGSKRIYAFRRPDGLLVRVTNLTGGHVYAEKLIKPITAQGFKSLVEEKDKYHLTIPELGIRIEIMVHPNFLNHSDFVPWSSSKSHGFQKGELRFVVYRNLITLKHGEPWPLDSRYNVLLEPNLMTGMLQRLVIENGEPLTFSNSSPSYTGPIKYSDWMWNRPAFKVVARDFDEKAAREIYVRDYYGMRTDNLVFWEEGIRANIDFFVGSSPVLEPILESTFLTRLADPSFSTVVEESRFTSYPKVVSDASFYEPDHTAPFVPRVKGFQRKIERNRKGERILLAESLFIRGSYVDWRNNRIVIPPAGLNYSSRNARNLRALDGESFFMLGKRAFLTSYRAGTFVRKDFHLDFWKNQPMGDGNLMYWQDQLLGERNKTLRFTNHHYLDDRPVAEMSLMKYSGNRWAAHFLLAQGLDRQGTNRYAMPEIFTEGATWIIPEYIGSNYVKIKEFGTPSIEAMSFTYTPPRLVTMGVGESAPLGKYTLVCTALDTAAKTASLSLKNKAGETVATKVIGPLSAEIIDVLPQYQPASESLQFLHEDVQAEFDVRNPFDEGKVRLFLFTDIQVLERDTPFEFDPRFMVRPDVCGHCYQLNEVLLDNPEPIILDKDNPVYEGIKGEDGKPLFRIVIDSFDGEMIHAWHIEANEKGKYISTDNLAFRPRKNVDVLMGVTGSTEGFLRLSMLPRLGFMEYWRVNAKAPSSRLSGEVNTGGSAHIKR
jgi:hypothetical protein